MTALGDVVRSAEELRPDDDPRACDVAAQVVSDRAQGEAYVASVCFKHGPPRRTGVELEYTVHHSADPRRPITPDVLAAALGEHVPRTVSPESPHLPLPAGSVLTVEPGGQVEISTLPHPDLGALAQAATADLAQVIALLAEHELVLGDAATDAHRGPRRILSTPRYTAMERRFSRIGPDGAVMMCATAGLQVCVDIGEPGDLAARWAGLHAMGPALVALFANSSCLAGRETGMASARWQAVMRTEPARTAPAPITDDPAAAWAARVLDTPLLVVRDDSADWTAPDSLTFAQWVEGTGSAARLRRPTFDDLDYHLSTLFTPVRPRGYFEIRYLDAQPPTDWFPPVALVGALLSSPATVECVLEVCEPVAQDWDLSVRDGLADPGLARAAAGLVELGCAALPAAGLDEPTARSVTESLHRRVHDRTPRRLPA